MVPVIDVMIDTCHTCMSFCSSIFFSLLFFFQGFFFLGFQILFFFFSDSQIFFLGFFSRFFFFLREEKKKKKKKKKKEVSGRARTHDLYICIQCVRDPIYTTTDKLRRPRQIEVVNSLRALPFTHPCINSDRKSRLACARIGFNASETELKKLHQTWINSMLFTKNHFLHPKKKDNHRQPLFPDRPPYCFLLGMAYIFFNHCLLVGKKKPPSCTHLLNVNLFYLEKEESKLIQHNSSFPSPCVN